MATHASISAQADVNLMKDITKLIHRIERILVPINSLVHSTVGQKLDSLLLKAKSGVFFEDVRRFPHNELIGYEVRSIEPLFRKVAWPKFEEAIWETVNEGNADYQLPTSVLNDIAMEKQAHDDRLEKAANKERVRRLQQRNGLPIISGKWRKEPYATRAYEYLTDYAVTANVGEAEAKELREQLVTPLNGFLGQAYNYDDHDLTEEWMVTFQDKSSKGPSEDDVIRTQLESLLEIMMVAVQDRVCTETGVLQCAPLQLGVDIKEVPVWGLDCYTRRMVEMAIEDRVPADQRDQKTIKRFIERALLPTINDQSPEKAHDMTHTIMAILSNPKSTAQHKLYAEAVRGAIQEYTIDVFRIHPKGTGVVCINPAGIQPHVFLTSYLGELYPSYRWCERLDVVEQAQQTFELKPTLPDFWNILLERPRQDPNGYGLLYVDASRKANNASSCSHSCDSNCTSAVVARNGKLAIALTTNRYVHYGEELTMDYYSITTSDMEWRAAICLCGSPECRGSFLHYATQDDLQQVLNQSCGPLWRYASLLRACSERPLTAEDSAVLVRHGMQSAALGANPPTWVKKFAVDNLRFVEFERKALPQALLRTKDGSKSLYTYSAADMDARSVMEQRLQSMVCCFSMVQQVITRNELNNSGSGSNIPLVPYNPADAVNRVWQKLLGIPQLLREHLLEPAQAAVRQAQAVSKKEKEREVAAAFAVSAPSLPASGVTTVGAFTASSNVAPTTDTALPASSASASEADKTLPAKRAVVAQILAAQEEIAKLLAEKPKGLNKLREACLALRTVLKTLENASTARARMGQLCDVLVFWAHTVNFSTVRLFGAVESGPIEVYARELGNNIPRSKVFKTYRGADISLRSRDKTSDGPDVSTFTAKAVKSDAAVVAKAESRSEAPVEAQTANYLMDVESVDNASSGNVNDSDNTSSEATSETSTNENLNASEQEQALLHPGSFSKDPFLASDETVFVGTKKYNELFTFWQVMGWFNAGTDQKIEAPDLFGCVELPSPANCFGVAEVPYGAKQREALVALLGNDKSQTMSWPALLKQSFTPTAVTSAEAPLYGSPMLDGALGQVSAVAKVISALQEGLEPARGTDKKKKGTAGASATTTKKDDGKMAQFDSILPPEAPTSWVQCELCRKWRRVAWSVNPDALPDLWECHMNTWDQENATCEAPQDGYDPEAENTLGFGTSEVAVDEKNFTVGKKFDLWCTRNLVYYEALVVKLKHNAKKPKDVPKAQFRFVGWGARYDEWVPIDSDRIQPHNLHTNPTCSNPREQERWQGRKDLYTDLVSTKKPAPTISTAKGAGKGKGKGKGKGSTGPKEDAEDSEEDDCADGDANAGTSRKRKSPAKSATKSSTEKVPAAAAAGKTSSSRSAKTAASAAISSSAMDEGYADDFEDLIPLQEPVPPPQASSSSKKTSAPPKSVEKAGPVKAAGRISPPKLVATVSATSSDAALSSPAAPAGPAVREVTPELLPAAPVSSAPHVPPRQSTALASSEKKDIRSFFQQGASGGKGAAALPGDVDATLTSAALSPDLQSLFQSAYRASTASATVVVEVDSVAADDELNEIVSKVQHFAEAEISEARAEFAEHQEQGERDGSAEKRARLS